jgi:hypothetical protein
MEVIAHKVTKSNGIPLLQDQLIVELTTKVGILQDQVISLKRNKQIGKEKQNISQAEIRKLNEKLTASEKQLKFQKSQTRCILVENDGKEKLISLLKLELKRSKEMMRSQIVASDKQASDIKRMLTTEIEQANETMLDCKEELRKERELKNKQFEAAQMKISKMNIKNNQLLWKKLTLKMALRKANSRKSSLPLKSKRMIRDNPFYQQSKTQKH